MTNSHPKTKTAHVKGKAAAPPIRMGRSRNMLQILKRQRHNSLFNVKSGRRSMVGGLGQERIVVVKCQQFCSSKVRDSKSMRQAGCLQLLTAYHSLLGSPRIQSGLTLLMTFTRMQTHINHLRLSVLTATKKADEQRSRAAEEICEIFFILFFVWPDEFTLQKTAAQGVGRTRIIRGLSADNRFALVNQSNSYSFRFAFSWSVSVSVSVFESKTPAVVWS